MPTPEPISQCLVCASPLGQESKDQDWRVCHIHRLCTVCKGPLNRLEVHNAHESAKDEISSQAPISELILQYLAHSRCQLATSARRDGSQDPSVLVKQSYLDWLNNFRLICDPNVELSQQTNEKQADLACPTLLVKMTLEEKFLFLARMESAVAHVSIAIKSDRKLIKEKLDEREYKKFKAASQEAAVSGRPASKPATDEKEILIAEFARQNNLSDPAARIIWKERSKAIRDLVKANFPEKTATEIVDKMLREQGRIK